MAAREPAQTHPDTPGRAVTFNGFVHIFRTARVEAARGGQKGGDTNLIYAESPRQDPLQRRRSRSTSLRISAMGASSALRRGLMTMDHWGFSRSRQRRIASRTRRRIRLRMTALPTARGRVKPIRGPSASGSRRQNAAKRGPEKRLPWSYTRRKSLERSRRTRFGKPGMETYLSELTVSFLRPRARRRARTARPFLVSIRERKP